MGYHMVSEIALLTLDLADSLCRGILIQYFIQFGCSYIDGVASFRVPWGLQMSE